MKKLERCMAPTLFVAAVFWTPRLCRAQSAFNGVWRIDAAQSKLSPKPNAFYIAKGWYHCTSCSPAIDTEADGKDHAVQGDSYDSLSVRVIDLHTIELTAKKSGKLIYDQTRTVSANGKELTVKTTVHPANSSNPVNSEIIAMRTGIVPSGVHATSGEWRIEKLNESINGLSFTDKVSGGEFTRTDPMGESFTAKLDGTSAPVKGAYDFDTVSVKLLNPNTIEETDMRNGAVVHVTRMTVNGNAMQIEATDKLTGRTDNLIAHKQ
jgi:hypothetical protein